jgi:hypothetical protein
MAVNDTRSVLRIAAVLAWISAALYALIALGIPYPDLEVQRVMFAVASVAYLAGGAILWRGFNRRLIAFGAVANAAVMVIWLIRAVSGASPADGFALASKLVEVLLEVALLALVFGPFGYRAPESRSD